MKTISGWYMTAVMGKEWTHANGRTVKYDKGVWSDELRRWLTPDEIEAAESSDD